MEPSAGQGAIIEAIHRSHPQKHVFCYELMPENRELLGRMEDITILGDDFISSVPECVRHYDKIIANPPFSGNQDVDHVMAMWDALKPGGRIVTITGLHWTSATENKCALFRDFLKTNNASVYEIDGRTFSKSGTDIETRLIVIDKIMI